MLPTRIDGSLPRQFSGCPEGLAFTRALEKSPLKGMESGLEEVDAGWDK